MKRIALATALIQSFFTVSTHAGPRTSTDYTVTTDTNDIGGQRTASATYTNDGSLGGITDVSTSSHHTAKQGYVAQLTDITGLALTATTPEVHEVASTQLNAWHTLDDATLLAVPTTSVAWSVASGPLTSISASGLATAGTVYEDSPATAQGSFATLTGSLVLNVLNTIPDNFGIYAGDNLADDWQFQNFGLENPLAAPLVDPDGDGQNNAFEYTAGLNPTNPLSRFLVTISPVEGQPQQKNISYGPIVSGRNYVVKTNLTLSSDSWNNLMGGSVSNDGDQRTVTDPNASEPIKFYQVEIVKP